MQDVDANDKKRALLLCLDFKIKINANDGHEVIELWGKYIRFIAKYLGINSCLWLEHWKYFVSLQVYITLFRMKITLHFHFLVKHRKASGSTFLSLLHNLWQRWSPWCVTGLWGNCYLILSLITETLNAKKSVSLRTWSFI